MSTLGFTSSTTPFIAFPFFFSTLHETRTAVSLDLSLDAWT